MLSRRRFLGVTTGAVAAGAIGGRLAWGGLLGDQVEASRSSGGGPLGTATNATGSRAPSLPTNRVLVVVQLSGGNDGLNTLVPVGDGKYFDARPTLQVKDADVLKLSGADRWGLHPALAPLLGHWEQGRLAAIDAVGFPDQTRSHFAASDTWWSAAPKDGATTGWLGRWLDTTADPTNPLHAIALGGGSPALIGRTALSTVVLDPTTFSLRTPKGADAKTIRDAFLATGAPLAAEPIAAAAQRAVPSALDAVDLLAKATGRGAEANGEAGAGAGGFGGEAKKGENQFGLTELLQTAAGIIDLQIGTQVLLVAGSGFDTHSDQANRHPLLLADAAAGIAGFLDAMQQQGRADDVLVITTSEFGRRVQENGSGTDHGDGNVGFALGPMVDGGRVIGEADLTKLGDGDVRSTIDARSLYANAIDWLSGAAGAADEVLGAPYDRYSLLRS